MPISFCKARLWLIISFLVHNSLVYSFNTCNVTETQERNEREREVECVPRHNDYMVLGKQKGWRGNSQEYGRTWGLSLSLTESERGLATLSQAEKSKKKKGYCLFYCLAKALIMMIQQYQFFVFFFWSLVSRQSVCCVFTVFVFVFPIPHSLFLSPTAPIQSVIIRTLNQSPSNKLKIFVIFFIQAVPF